MGKRSDFERVEKDFYRTIDPRAVAALAPHLKPQTRFAEPCAGAGDLIKALEEIGHRCVWQSDIAFDDPVDAAMLNMEVVAPYADAVITNPPWTRNELHPIIENLSAGLPTWLLFDADWAHTRQSAPYMGRCTDIVSIGRLIWIPGTTTSGKDNCAWYRFSRDKDGPTRFHGRA
jgi:hypothetical protein